MAEGLDPIETGRRLRDHASGHGEHAGQRDGDGRRAEAGGRHARLAAGNHDGLVSDDYIRITVFLAGVLFLAGIGSSFKLPGIRYALITFGSAILVLAVVLILQQPGLPEG